MCGTLQLMGKFLTSCQGAAVCRQEKTQMQTRKWSVTQKRALFTDWGNKQYKPKLGKAS